VVYYRNFMKILLRVVGLLEGLSYILLLFIATPVKYFMSNESYVKMLGMPHGMLFIAYIVLVVLMKEELNLKGKSFVWALLASIIPFGTFYVDHKYFKN